jgi:hypothetical protein
MEVSGQLHALAALILRKETLIPIGQESESGLQSGSRLCGEEKHFLPLPGIEPSFPGFPVSNQVTILSYPDFTERKIKQNMNGKNGEMFKRKKCTTNKQMKGFL